MTVAFQTDMSRFCADGAVPDHSVRRRLYVLVWLGLATACTASAQNTVGPGELFAGPLIAVKAPSTGKWFLQRRSDTAITFAGGEIGNTLVAEVSMFRLAPAATPEEFESLIKEGAARDGDPKHPDRYERLEQAVKYPASGLTPASDTGQ